MKKLLLFLFIVFIFLSLSSCKTPAPEVITEYVPVHYDWDTLLNPIKRHRPEVVQLIENPETLSDIMQNSVSFQYAYENWKAYALALEGFYHSFKASE